MGRAFHRGRQVWWLPIKVETLGQVLNSLRPVRGIAKHVVDRGEKLSASQMAS